MKTSLPFLIVALLSLLWTAPALSHSYHQGDIQIGHLWSRATPGTSTVGAVYGPFLNTGTQSDRLIHITSPWAQDVKIHQTVKEQGHMDMQMLDALPLNPNQPVSLSPGKTHIMLMGLTHELKEGDRIPLTLTFEKAGSIDVEAIVEKAGTRNSTETPP